MQAMKTVPAMLPQNMQTAVEMLCKTRSQDECLRKAYGILTEKYHGDRLKTLLRFVDLFPGSLEKLWSWSGFLHCTNLNRLLRMLLVQSGHFADSDITMHWTLLWYVSPHQFAQVAMSDGRKIRIDLWAETYGIPFGDHAHGFHAYGKK
jgi:hypothetical protein